MTAFGLRIKAARQWWGLRGLRNIHFNISTQMAWLLAIACAALLVGLITYWLMLATRTALLSKDLELLEAKNKQLIEQINHKWTDIGTASTQDSMEQRARTAGYHPADRVEYLVTETTRDKLKDER